MASDQIIVTLPSDASPDLIARVRDAFPEAVAAGEAPVETAIANPMALEAALATAVSSAGGLGPLLATWSSSIPGGPVTLLLIGLALLLAYGAERGLRALIESRLPRKQDPASYAERLRNGLFWLGGRLLLVCFFVVVARVIGRTILPPDPGLRELGLGLLGPIVLGRVIIIFIAALTAPGEPQRRLMGFEEGTAARILQLATVIASIVVGLRLLRAIVVDAAGTAPEAQLALVAFMIVNAVAAAIFFLSIRKPVTALMIREDEGVMPGWRVWSAKNWHWGFLLLILIDASLKIVGIVGLLGPDATGGAGHVIFTVLVATLLVAALGTLRHEPEIERMGSLVQGGLVLVEGLAIVGTAVLLLLLWGINPLTPPETGGLAAILSRLVEASVIIVVGIALWRAVVALISGSADDDGAEDDGGDGMGGEGSRIETVVPILRGFALTLIAVTTGMSALAALGINIGPLIASAGVVGLAIGFGAQKLVTDVISGLFYLYEDAFRLGEYVVTDGGKGTVERISIRSATIRHHNGPIYTIPFSAMGTIQNHSRDYVVMKFSFAVPDDTDVEMVRKLVKKAGQELAADPELDGKLIAPLKSQGAISIRGRSFEIGCKFTAKPGDQFVIR
ncbi:MAG: mechanosensitive ion channel domain-containing protein, partial [Pseudomonadota bacterium]